MEKVEKVFFFVFFLLLLFLVAIVLFNTIMHQNLTPLEF